MSDETDDLLRILIKITARGPVAIEDLSAIVEGKAGSAKQKKAYNLCDGSRRMAEVAKVVGIDSGNFSRTVARWESSGILFRVGVDGKLMHLYPLP